MAGRHQSPLKYTHRRLRACCISLLPRLRHPLSLPSALLSSTSLSFSQLSLPRRLQSAHLPCSHCCHPSPALLCPSSNHLSSSLRPLLPLLFSVSVSASA
eukprot:scaffold233911_cov28-Tisochrysis_lutea.AAC.2